jgi:hypothetical protein
MLENNTPEIVFDLAMQGRFKSLSPEQQQMVSNHLSEEEFDNIHLLSSNLNTVFVKDVAGIKPNPQIRAELLAKFPAKQWNFDILKNLFNYKIPVYRFALGAAAAYVALFIITPMFKQSNQMDMAGNNQTVAIQKVESTNKLKSIDEIYLNGGTGVSIDESDIFTGASLADDALLKKVLEIRN